MPNLQWMIYGAYGFTGNLIAREAVARGYRPTLGGRNAAKLRAIAQELGLPYQAFSLADRTELAAIVAEQDIVLHAAGPYTETASPMIEACLEGGTHYVDIAGELSVFTRLYEHHGEALRRGVALIPGCGFDVVPTDSLAAYLHERLPGAVLLELALDSVTQLSRGTAKAAMEVLANGGFVRQNGRLKPAQIGERGPNARFHGGDRKTMLAPFADLESAYRTTGIPNIRTYLALPPGFGFVASIASPAHRLMAFGPTRRFVQSVINRALGKRNATKEGYASIWGRVTDAEGQSVEGWMRTPEPYHYTAESAVNVVEQLAGAQFAGTLTPAGAFGTDFALLVPGTERFDRFVL